MMFKIISPGAQDFGEPIAQMVKVSSRGLRGNDLNDFVKRAGHEFLPNLEMVKAGEVPVHLIALGAREFFGSNRNGDGFSDPVLDRFHTTFEKYARFYRNHKNKDPKISYGRVIKSAYHKPMRRVELLVGLNGDERAVERNGGFIADKEMEKLARHEDIPVSMACRVPYDVCSGCQNRARSRDEYCDGDMCKYGGLKHNIGRTFGDGHTLYADNTEPTFFDISNVYKPADRIAYSFGKLEKAASAGLIDVISGAELAEQIGLEVPYEMLIDPSTPTKVAKQIKLAHILADVEKSAGRRQTTPVDAAFHPAVQSQIRQFPDLSETTGRLGQTMTALANEKVALSLRDFLTLIAGNVKQAELALPDVAEQLPGVFDRLANSANIEAELRENPYNPGHDVPSVSLRTWAVKHASDHSLDDRHVATRLSLASLRGVEQRTARKPSDALVKEAADMGGAEKLARQYAMYKLAFLNAVSEPDDEDFQSLATLLVRQNYLS